MKPIPLPFLLLFLSLLAGCTLPDDDPEKIVCTAEHRINFCVTLNGSTGIPDSIRILRIRPRYTDTLISQSLYPVPKPLPGNCFGESGEASTLRVMEGHSILKEVQVGKVRTVDGCHSADTTIHIVY